MGSRRNTIFGMILASGLALLLLASSLTGQASSPELQLAPMFGSAAEQQGIAALVGPALTPLLYEQHSQTLVQYTRTHRFELVDGRVQLAALGRELTHHRQAEAPFQWQDKASLQLSDTAIFIDEAGHSLDEPFRSYWEQHGNVLVFGWPISEAFVEQNAMEGTPRLVQYFERGRLVTAVPPAEYTGKDDERNADEGSIESGIVGNGIGANLNAAASPAPIQVTALGEQHVQLLRGFDANAFLELPTPGGGSGDVAPLASASWYFNPTSNDGRNMARAMELLDGQIVETGGRLSALASIGPLTAENGYLPGSAIENGQIVGDSIAGGVCAVSTLIYRAAWTAGLPIYSRSGHSLFLDTFHDGGWLGIEAAIDSRGPDLVIGNNTRGPMVLRAEVDPARHRLTVTIYGLPDGRVVKRLDPEPSAALSDILRENGLLSMADDPEEVSIVNTRLIIYPDGRTQTDRVKTYYRMP